jgi:YidC/Oxa1 family membrane protein insertase
MRRKDLPWILLLAVFLFAWPVIDRKLILPLFPSKPAIPAVPAPAVVAEEAAPARPEPAPAVPAFTAPVGPEETPDTAPERTATLSNDSVEMLFSSRGAALVSVKLKGHRTSVDPESPPVLLDFSDRYALAYAGLPGLGQSHDFDFQTLENGTKLRFERRTAGGMQMVRTVTLQGAYGIEVRDEFRNGAAEGVLLPPHAIRLGRLTGRPGETHTKGIEYLGLDTLSPGGEKVQYWGKKFAKLFSVPRGQRPPVSMEQPYPGDGQRLDWAALKEKYFVLILTPEGGADSAATVIRRKQYPEETTRPDFKPPVILESVEADVKMTGPLTAPPGEALERVYTLYAGPKQYSELSRFRNYQVDVMEFGRLGAIGKILLRAMVFFHGLLPNYGIAVILLTCLIRLVFWPLTHKSGQSMRKMQELQPEIAKIKATIKDPKKQQVATMALYKEHKVNPVGGCLPMLIQIPVFIALFVVLRSAIELRFAPFLWIRDLSEPENLFPGLIPYVSGLNLLPLIMTALQVWQQKLTPAGGDPAQQKMMTWMPVIMLVFFYNFASGLVLYWTVNQALMIVQLLMQKRRVAHRAA